MTRNENGTAPSAESAGSELLHWLRHVGTPHSIVASVRRGMAATGGMVRGPAKVGRNDVAAVAL